MRAVTIIRSNFFRNVSIGFPFKECKTDFPSLRLVWVQSLL
jgi:hypothetical protein